MLDLSHWVDGDYRVAGESMADETTIEDADPRAGPAQAEPARAEPTPGRLERPASSKGRSR
jgi:hypothetical protein